LCNSLIVNFIHPAAKIFLLLTPFFHTLLMGPIFGQPPDTPKRIVTDTYFGKDIDDPYRWLENVKDPEVLKWLGAQTWLYSFSSRPLAGRERNYLPHYANLISETPPPLVSFVRDAKVGITFSEAVRTACPRVLSAT
jgi:hypothetical protein